MEMVSSPTHGATSQIPNGKLNHNANYECMDANFTREFGMYRMRLSKQALLDAVDRKSPMAHTTYRWVNLCASCCCPCLILGSIETAINREEAYSVTRKFALGHSLLPNNEIVGSFGPKGFNTCALTCCFTTVCWPCSPFLSLYLIQQRAYYRQIYREPETNLSFCESVSDVSVSCLLWPFVILQHAMYLSEKKEKGLLIFDWEHEVVRDMKIKKPPIENKIVLIIGPRGAGKTALFTKLVGAVESIAVEEARDRSKINIGFRGVTVNDEKILFLEFWDVPCNDLETLSFQAGLVKAHAIVFVFDGSETDDHLHSFAAMQRIYDAVCVHLHSRPHSAENGHQEKVELLECSGPKFVGRKVCAATKSDIVNESAAAGTGTGSRLAAADARPGSPAMDRLESQLQLRSSIRPFLREAMHSQVLEGTPRKASTRPVPIAPFASSHKRIQIWSKRNAIPIVETSAVDNSGVARLLRLLRVDEEEYERIMSATIS